jgi:dienelactone hydrolase
MGPHPGDPMKTSTAARAASLLLIAALAACAPKPETRWNGAWRAVDGTLAVVTASQDGSIRYRIYATGETRRLFPLRDGRYESRVPAALAGVPGRSATFAGDTFTLTRAEGAPLELRRLALPERDVAFDADGATLRGRLVLPPGPGPHPAIVIAHGSGDDAAQPYYGERYLFAAHGIATLLFDKRGTGASGGRYGMDFGRLARDVVAGVEWLKAQPGIDARRIGVSGYSQGGWIAPLAASLSTDVRFVIVNYGMIESPAFEEIEETLQTLRERGAGDADLAEARELLGPAMTIVGSNFAEGWDEFRAVAARYADRAWLGQLDDTTVGAFMRYPSWAVKLLGPWRTTPGQEHSWHHDSGRILDRLDIPMAWLLGAEDLEAPNARTIARLRDYRERGKPYEVVVFEGADHGILLYQVVDGQRIYTGMAPNYYPLMVGAARRFAGLE